MDDLFSIVIGSVVVFIGLIILANVILMFVDELRKTEQTKISRTWYIVIGIVSIILFTIYETYEAPKIYEPQILDKITYLGPLDVFFSTLYTFEIGFIIAYIVASLLISGILKKEGKKYIKQVRHISLVVALLGVFCYFGGTKTIDSFFARDKFITTYMVNLFPEDAKEKNYRVKADIRVNNGSIFSYEDKEVYILKIYFSNGGYLVPQDEDSYDFAETKKIRVKDQNGKWWYVEIPY